MNFVAGDIVSRHSYNNDLLFRIQRVNKQLALLHGVDYRLAVDAPLTDLNRVQDRELEKWRQSGKQQEEFSYRLFRQDYQLIKEKRDYEVTAGYEHNIPLFRLPIKVLHLDGDPNYLKKCIELYKRLGIQVHGTYLNEKEMPTQIGPLINKVQPEIVVITGHDSYSKSKGKRKDLRAYRNSTFFIEAVREAREIIPSVDQLIIFAGACQSHFESLIRAGANFASSPERINIHALDPVYIAAKLAYTPFMESVNVWDLIRSTLTGEKGLGGIETKGLYRVGMPYVDQQHSKE